LGMEVHRAANAPVQFRQSNCGTRAATLMGGKRG
jgi:hypothetical protein